MLKLQNIGVNKLINKQMKLIPEVTKQWLGGIPIPARTDSYSPVAHAQLLDFIDKRITNVGLSIKDSGVISTNNGNKIIARWDINGDNPDIGNRLYVRNSYDKTASIALVAGNVAFICSNGMVVGDIVYTRKHTGEVWLELIKQFDVVLEHLDINLRKAVIAKQELEQAPLINPIDQVSHMLGHLFYKEEIITSVQLNEMKQELTKSSSGFKSIDSQEFTLWDFYNAGTQALKRTHPSDYLEAHADFHQYMMNYKEEAHYV